MPSVEPTNDLLSPDEQAALRDPGKRALIAERRARKFAELRVRRLERKLALAEAELAEITRRQGGDAPTASA